MEKIDAILRVELGLNPDELTAEEWAGRYNEWAYVQTLKSRVEQKIMELSVLKALAKAFGKAS